jgi:hypothetical protein
VTEADRAIHVGEPVEVHVRYNDSWTSGFEVVEILDGGFLLKRLSDGSLLPGRTDRSDLRRPANVSQ